MSLLVSPGATAVALGVAGTKRDDISDYLMASLIIAPNFIGSLQVGAEFSDNICKWTEDKLNQDLLTDTTGAGQSAVSVTMTMSASDANQLRIGYVLADTSAAVGGVGGSEKVQVIAVTGTTVTITRAFGTLPAATTHAQNAVWAVIARPELESSDLNNDQSRARTVHMNYVSRQSIDVIISTEALNRARRGYTPGINNELEYQFYQRMEEAVRAWDRAVIYSPPSPGGGTIAVSGGDYSTFAGVRSFLDGTLNSVSGPSTVGTVTPNWATQGWALGAIDSAVNYSNKLAYRAGAYPDWALCGPNGGSDVGRLYSDRIRIEQSTMTRGFAANMFRSLLANEFKLIVDGYVTDGAGVGELFILDSRRIRLRPLADQFCSVITAPTFRDGDAVRAIMKTSLEVRNTGTDSGQAHYLTTNCSFNQN